MLVLALASASQAIAARRCTRPDLGFGTFLKRFRSDRDFQMSRVTIPLRYAERGPGAASTSWLSSAEVRVRWRTGLLQAPSPRANEFEEAAVCEEAPHVVADKTSLVQYSCHTDLFGNTFHFRARGGCWYLAEVASSGG